MRIIFKYSCIITVYVCVCMYEYVNCIIIVVIILLILDNNSVDNNRKFVINKAFQIAMHGVFTCAIFN